MCDSQHSSTSQVRWKYYNRKMITQKKRERYHSFLLGNYFCKWVKWELCNDFVSQSWSCWLDPFVSHLSDVEADKGKEGRTMSERGNVSCLPPGNLPGPHFIAWEREMGDRTGAVAGRGPSLEQWRLASHPPPCWPPLWCWMCGGWARWAPPS